MFEKILTHSHMFQGGGVYIRDANVDFQSCQIFSNTAENVSAGQIGTFYNILPLPRWSCLIWKLTATCLCLAGIRGVALLELSPTPAPRWKNV